MFLSWKKIGVDMPQNFKLDRKYYIFLRLADKRHLLEIMDLLYVLLISWQRKTLLVSYILSSDLIIKK
jgi:hypothetical protein